MILADLIKGNKTAITLQPATAILAIPAILSPNQAEKQAKNSRIAEIALAGSEQAETIPAIFEQDGHPLSCPYWFQVCHAVEYYQEDCTRCTDCRIFKFLKVNS